MKSVRTFFEKLRAPSGPPAAPTDAAEPVAEPQSQNPAPNPDLIKMPAELADQLFPKQEVMVSAVFDCAISADATPAAGPATAPGPAPSELEPQPPVETPEVLSISDELREAIFPKQKVMVSVLFTDNPPKPITPEPGRRHRHDDERSGAHDFPIV